MIDNYQDQCVPCQAGCTKGVEMTTPNGHKVLCPECRGRGWQYALTAFEFDRLRTLKNSKEFQDRLIRY